VSNSGYKLQRHVTLLEKEIKDAQKPLILTEGKYDAKILEIVWQKLNEGQECPYIFRPVDPTDVADGGSGGAEMLLKAIEAVHPADMRKAIAIFDRDTEGIKAFNKLSKNFKTLSDQDSVKVHINKLAFAILLPVPSGRENYADNESLSIEFMFTDDILHKRTGDNRGLKLKKHLPVIVYKNKTFKLNQQQLSLLNFQDICYGIVDGKKTFVNEIVPSLDETCFNSFRPLCDLLERIIND
jgi:hypothetical protein